MRTADDIEAEILKAIQERAKPGMSAPDYISAVTAAIVRYMAEHLAGEPCTYEVRDFPFPIYASYTGATSAGTTGAFCTKHGWYCPNMKAR